MNTALHNAAAEALAAALPVTFAVTPAPTPWKAVPDAREIISATFVGTPSADVAISLNDPADVAGAGGNPGLVSLPDVLRPSLEAAVATLGNGVLGQTSVSSADPVFTDSAATVYALNAGDKTIGFFAIRVRESTGLPVGLEPLNVPSINGRLNRINDVEMALTVEIGRTRMPIRDVLNMEPGSVIELDRSAGAPADVLLNGRLIAHGEVVVVDQDYAVRITKILDVAGLG